MMTRKDFKRIADNIKTLSNPDARFDAAKAMADVCAISNPRFNRVKFLLACGVAA
jgi:hypothetical protein